MDETKSPNRSIGWKIAVLILAILLIASTAAALAYMSKSEALTVEAEELNAKLDKTYSERYNDGYADGRDAGYGFGYNDGKDKGYDEGKDKGLIEGWEASRRSYEFCFYNNGACIVVSDNSYYHHLVCPDLLTAMLSEGHYWILNIEAAKNNGYSPCPVCWESGLIEESESQRIIDRYRLQQARSAVGGQSDNSNDSSDYLYATSEQRQQNGFVQSTAPSQPQTYTVYVTATGSKYHRAGCSYLKSSRAISLADAIAAGYTPCSRCW